MKMTKAAQIYLSAQLVLIKKQFLFAGSRVVRTAAQDYPGLTGRSSDIRFCSIAVAVTLQVKLRYAT
jgi:hypothetical protein